MYRLNVQVTAYGRQTVPDRVVVRSCDPLKNWGSNHITGTAEPKVVKFCTLVGHINSSNRMTKAAWLWSMTCHDAVHRMSLSATAELLVTFGVAFHFFVAGNHRHLKFSMWIEHSKSQPTYDKLSLKWAWSRHVTHFTFLVLLRYLWNGLS